VININKKKCFCIIETEVDLMFNNFLKQNVKDEL